MNGDRLIGYIPKYPKGCSMELLAVKAGYVRGPYSKGRLEKGVRKLKKDLAWTTLTDQGLVERLLPIQQSTRKALAALGVPDPEGEMTVYISKWKEM